MYRVSQIPKLLFLLLIASTFIIAGAGTAFAISICF